MRILKMLFQTMRCSIILKNTGNILTHTYLYLCIGVYFFVYKKSNKNAYKNFPLLLFFKNLMTKFLQKQLF